MTLRSGMRWSVTELSRLTVLQSDGMDETLCALDEQIVDDELHEVLVAKVPHGATLTAVLDCTTRAVSTRLLICDTSNTYVCLVAGCHSGTGLDLPYSFHPTSTSSKGGIVRVGRKKSPGLTVMLSGCQVRPQVLLNMQICLEE